MRVLLISANTETLNMPTMAMGFLMLGSPSETRDTALESLRFADALPLALMRLTVGRAHLPLHRPGPPGRG